MAILNSIFVVYFLALFLVQFQQTDAALAFTGCDQGKTYTFDENLGVTTTVCTAKATGNSGAVTWVATPTPAESAFEITKSGTNFVDGTLKLVKKLDYESKTTYKVIVKITSGVETFQTEITVNVNNLFDVAPTSTKTKLDCEVNENTAKGSVVSGCDITFTDTETSYIPPDALTYSLEGNAADKALFAINPSNAQIKIQSAPDAETQTVTTSLFIVATDKGANQKKIPLTITIKDLNDNAPKCKKVETATYLTNYNEAINEETAIGSTDIINLSCDDDDQSSPNNQVECSLSTVNSLIETAFSGSTCTLRTKSASQIDYDTSTPTTSLTLTIKVSDKATVGKKETNIVVQVTIRPINEHTPKITSSATATAVNENIGVNTVYTAVATDDDKGLDGQISFSLTSVSNSLASYFTIGETDGKIRLVTSPLDRESYSNIKFVVRATDKSATTKKSVEKTVQLNINDVNDLKPVFTPVSGAYVATLTEGSAITNSEVKTLSVTDPDVSATAVVCLIESGDSDALFSIDTSNKKRVILAKNWVVDTGSLKSVYNLVIGCTDENGSGTKSTATLKASLNLINNNVPTLSISPTTKTVFEDQALGVLASITADPKDSGETVSCAFTTANDLFELDGCNSIKLARSLDYEDPAQRSITLTVKATDSGTNPAVKSISKTFTLTVKNVNEFAPVCAPTSTVVDISETSTSAIDATILKLSCTDADHGSSVTNTIAEGNTLKFKINGDNLQRIGGATFDYDSADKSYVLKIKSVDNDDSAKLTYVTITVKITPVNEHTPTFTAATKTIKEDLAIGKVVTVFAAKDDDHDPHDIKAYEILSGGSGKFSIDNSGNVIVAKDLDVDAGGSAPVTYSLTVKATDKGNLFKTGTLTVKVDDINDNAPACTQSPKTISKDENTAKNTKITSVTATDADVSSSFKTITYKIVSGNDDLIFSIASASGDVSVGGFSQMDYEKATSHTLKIRATDGTFSSTCQLIVNVNDINEGKPTFATATKSVDMDEDKNLGFVVFTQTATDSDTGQTLSYSITSESPAGYFSVNSLGQVSLIKKTNFESGVVKFILKIKATDNHASPQSGTYDLTINLKNVNEHAPSCTVGVSVSTTVAENLGANLNIGNALSCSDSDVQSLTYSIHTIDGTVPGASPLFKVTSAGRLQATGTPKINYESKTSHVVVVKVEDTGLATKKHVLVTYSLTVTPVNEFSPAITSGTSFSVAENDAVNKLVFTATGTDADAGSNHGVITWSITGGNSENKFGIDSNNGQVRLTSQLDRESTPSYVLTVKATDGDSKTATAKVTVTVTDYNDNPPLPTAGTPQYKNINENTNVNTEIFKFGDKFSDKDAGPLNNAIKSYTVTYSPDNGDLGTEAETIQVKKALDAATTPVYTVTIVAKDKGSPEKSGTLVLQVYVKETNDHTPTFPTTSEIKIDENVAIGHHVVTWPATDNDGPTAGTITYTIDGGNTDGVFQIDSSTAKITVFKQLDYDTSPIQYTLRLKAEDNGEPKKNSIVSQVIKLNDINDSPPVFPSAANNAYKGSVDENVAIDTSVMTVKTTDKDSAANNNNKHTYTIQSTNGPANMFKIDANSGEIKTGLTPGPDRETLGTYKLTIRAVDGGSPKLTSDKIFTITINDLNDNSPQFNPSDDLTVSITEKVAVGYLMGTVTATDKDAGANGKVTYKLESDDAGASDPSNFDISADGKITNAKVLDREARSQYKLKIVASDGAVPAKTGVRKLIVDVLDVNDNDPTTTGPYTKSLDENLPAGTDVQQISASDKDTGVNAELTYAITAGNADDKFQVDANGLVELKAPLNREIKETHEITVRVSDKGAGPRFVDVKITVTVLDKNDNSPVFTSNPFKLTVPEMSAIDTNVGAALTFTDADKGNNQLATFAIEKYLSGIPTDAFKIDANSGQIKVNNAALDREATELYVLQVIAVDKGSPALTGTTTVSITMGDINDNHPLPKGQYTDLKTSEANPVDTVIVQIAASDADAGANAQIKFSFNTASKEGLWADEHLAIDADLGTIKIKKLLNREINETVAFYVVVTDQGVPPKSTQIPVTLTVLDENDNTPVCDKVLYDCEISYDDTSGNAFCDVTATDADKDANQKITYSLATSSAFFKVAGSSGKVSKDIGVKAAKQSKYFYDVVAADGGTPSRSAKCRLRIDTFDVSLHGVRVHFTMDNFVSQLPYILETLRTTLLFRHKECRVGYISHQASAVNNARRLLAQTQNAVLYAVRDNRTAGAGKEQVTKSFISATELLAIWRADSKGTPSSTLLSNQNVNFSIAAVEPYSEGAITDESFEKTALGIGVICLACFVLLLLIPLIAILVYYYKNRQRADPFIRNKIVNEDSRRAPIETRPPPKYSVEQNTKRTSYVGGGTSRNPLYKDDNPWGFSSAGGAQSNNRNITPVDVNF